MKPRVDPANSANLYLVATPIGHLGDMTFRAVEVLQGVSLIACEDTREAKKLLDHYSIRTPTISLFEHNEEDRIPEILRRIIEKRESVALISDAGTPLVSDPGFKLARAAIAQGITVVPIPGANAAMTALLASGLATDAFYFAGYLPPKPNARRQRLLSLKDIPATLLFHEAPHRIHESLADLLATLGDRVAVCAREMTKIHESFYRGRLSEIPTMLPDPVKGEITLVVEGALVQPRMTHEEVVTLLARALEDDSRPLREVCADLALVTGWGKNDLYRLALQARGSEG